MNKLDMMESHLVTQVLDSVKEFAGACNTYLLDNIQIGRAHV